MINLDGHLNGAEIVRFYDTVQAGKFTVPVAVSGALFTIYAATHPFGEVSPQEWSDGAIAFVAEWIPKLARALAQEPTH